MVCLSLFCFDLFSEPNLNAFWGLLDDIWYFYQGKISPFDLRYINNNEKKKSNKKKNNQTRHVR